MPDVDFPAEQEEQSDSASWALAVVPASIRYFPAPQDVHEEEPEEL